MTAVAAAGVVYLDQSHLSRMAKAKLGIAADPEELALFQALDRYRRAGHVVVPFSYWHVMETVLHDNDGARAEVCRVLGLLSQGRCFRWPWDIAFDEMQNAVEGTLVGTTCPTIASVGRGVDCFPRDSIAPETHAYVANIAPAEQFAASVDLGRESDGIRALAEAFNKAQHAIDLAMAERREQSRLPLEQVRPLVIEGLRNGTEVTAWITRTAATLNLPRPAVMELVTRDSFAAVPTLGMMVEVRARRDVVYGRRPTPSDPADVGHLLALPYCKWFLTERFATALTRDAAKLTNTTVLARPRELLDELAGAYGPPP